MDSYYQYSIMKKTLQNVKEGASKPHFMKFNTVIMPLDSGKSFLKVREDDKSVGRILE